MVTPGEGFVDRGKLVYYGGKPFVEKGVFKQPCPHSTYIGVNSKGNPNHEIPLTFVIFKGHPEEYKTEGICVLCAVEFLLRCQESGNVP